MVGFQIPTVFHFFFDTFPAKNSARRKISGSRSRSPKLEHREREKRELRSNTSLYSSGFAIFGTLVSALWTSWKYLRQKLSMIPYGQQNFGRLFRFLFILKFVVTFQNFRFVLVITFIVSQILLLLFVLALLGL